MIVVVETNALEVAQQLELKKRRLSMAVQDIARDLATRIMLDYQRTARSWTHRPKFERIVEIAGDRVTILVGTDDAIYKFVDEGTRPHFIFPRGNKPLAFQWGGPGSYRAATKPGVLGSGGHGPSGPIVFRRWVSHPGTAPRDFSKTIQEKYNRMAGEVAATHLRAWQSKQ